MLEIGRFGIAKYKAITNFQDQQEDLESTDIVDQKTRETLREAANTEEAEAQRAR